MIKALLSGIYAYDVHAAYTAGLFLCIIYEDCYKKVTVHSVHSNTLRDAQNLC